MSLPHIEHLGVAVESVEEALPFFEGVLGLTCYNTEEVANQKVRTVSLKIGEIKLELLKPTSDESPIARFIEKCGEGIHHLVLSSNDMTPVLEELRGRGIYLIDEKPRKGAEGLNITFAHSRSTHGILLGICDCKDVAR